MTDYLSLATNDTDHITGSPPVYRLVHDSDGLEVRAYYGPDTDDPYLAVLKFLSNQEAHLYGEMVMHQPAIRTFETLSINAVDSSEDIVSFRSGTSPGDEMLRILKDGTISSGNEQPLKLTSVAVLNGGPATSAIMLDTLSTLGSSKLIVEIMEDSSTLWSLSNDGILRSRYTGTTTIQAEDASALQTLKLEAEDISIEVDGNDLVLAKASATRTQLRSYQDFEINCSTVAEWTNFRVYSCDAHFYVGSSSECNFKVIAHGGDNMFEVASTGVITDRTRENTSAALKLDSTRTTNGKKWKIESDYGGSPTGSLKFVNETDTGTPMVEFDAEGSVYAEAFVGAEAVSSQPDDADGRVGAMVVDTNGKLWCKVSNTGTDRWWYVDLSAP